MIERDFGTNIPCQSGSTLTVRRQEVYVLTLLLFVGSTTPSLYYKPSLQKVTFYVFCDILLEGEGMFAFFYHETYPPFHINVTVTYYMYYTK